MDTYPVTARCVGRFFRTDGKYLGRVYKEHLSDFRQWEQKAHAGEWVLLDGNMGERLSIDETTLHNDLFTSSPTRTAMASGGRSLRRSRARQWRR